MDGASADRAFTETRREIERLMAGDPALFEAGGTADATQSGEEYRQHLRRALDVMGHRIRTLPWRSGSGVAKGDWRGYVFTAIVGEQPFVRFVPWGETDPGPVVHNDALCLRLLECVETTPRVLPDDLRAGAFAAWDVARRAIHADWQYDTDPAHLQPKVPPFLREVAAFLRTSSPPETSAEDLAEVIAIISGRIPRRNEIRLREAFAAEYPGNRAKAAAVVNAIRESGLQPSRPRAPLPPIGPEEIHLICWMAIEALRPGGR